MDIDENKIDEAATKHQFSALNLGYYLWKEGKNPETRQFARRHTPDTVFY